MTWVRIDDEAREHPKLLAAGAEAAWLWACALMYANHQKRRDGFIPTVVLPALYAPLATKAKKLAGKLVEVGLFDVVEGGYSIHDYREYQPSNGAEVTEARREAGRVGGLRSGEARRSKTEATCFEANEANPKQVTRTTSHPVPSLPIPERDQSARTPVRDVRWETPTEIPADAELTDELRAIADPFALQELEIVWSKFVGHRRDVGKPSHDWAAAWRKWCADERQRQLQAKQREAQRPSGPRPVADTPPAPYHKPYRPDRGPPLTPEQRAELEAKQESQQRARDLEAKAAREGKGAA